jgi:uncharacterized protein (DUF433 family)
LGYVVEGIGEEILKIVVIRAVEVRGTRLYGHESSVRPITVEPGIAVAKARIHGMRITVRRVLEILATYRERAEIFREYLFRKRKIFTTSASFCGGVGER